MGDIILRSGAAVDFVAVHMIKGKSSLEQALERIADPSPMAAAIRAAWEAQDD